MEEVNRIASLISLGSGYDIETISEVLMIGVSTIYQTVKKYLMSGLDIKGTGSVSDLADNCFVIWRNKEKELAVHQAEIERIPVDTKYQFGPDCVWVCDKNRNGDWEGRLSFWFDKISLQYLETRDSIPQKIIDLTCADDLHFHFDNHDEFLEVN